MSYDNVLSVDILYFIFLAPEQVMCGVQSSSKVTQWLNELVPDSCSDTTDNTYTGSECMYAVELAFLA